MIKYCLWKWEAGKEELKNALSIEEGLDSCSYEFLVKLVVQHILNAPMDKDDNKNYDPDYDTPWDEKNITVIDDGEYQGTLLFLIPQRTYQPECDDYLMSHVYYGSCSVCDTLQNAQSMANRGDGRLSPEQVDAYMAICKDIVTNMIKPYNYGWRFDEWFTVCCREWDDEPIC